MATQKKAATDQPKELTGKGLDKKLKAEIGKVKIVRNKKRIGGANHSYHSIAITIRGGKKVVLMFTLKEIRSARERALKNTEDATALWELVAENDIEV